MERNFEDPIFINPPYFDFFQATDDFGFDFANFEENHFGKFINETYIDNFIQFRKAFISRDYLKVRFYAHKFKGIGK